MLKADVFAGMFPTVAVTTRAQETEREPADRIAECDAGSYSCQSDDDPQATRAI